MNHLGAIEARDGVILAEENGFFGADLLAETAVDAAGHVDIELLGTLLHLAPFVVLRDFHRLDSDRTWRANELAQLARNTFFSAIFIDDKRRGTAVPLGQVGIPFLLGILHGDDSLVEEGSLQMFPGDRKSSEDRRQVALLRESQFGTIDDDSHGVGLVGKVSETISDERSCP